jgi:hypothetical protein
VRCLRLLFVALLTAAQATYAAKLIPQTAAAFDRYVELTEARMNADLAPGRFLRIAGQADWQAKVRGGHIRIQRDVTLDNGKEIDVPGGMIQHWVGAMFISGATIQQVRAVLQDYESYKYIYKPEVIDSRLISHKGDEYDVFLRLYKKQVLTVVLNSTYHVRYGAPDPLRMYVISHSTRIAEVKDDKHPEAGEEPVGDDTGFLWRLNSYWRFEQAGGGVYAECEAISLSRDVPTLLGWMIKGFVEKFPKDSMLNTLRGTKAAVIRAATGRERR